MSPVPWPPELYASLVELPADTNLSAAGTPFPMGVPVDIPTDRRCGLGLLGDVALDPDSVPGRPDGGE